MEKTGATPPLSSPPFPGGGEMRARCRALDWSATPLGPAGQWPQSLRTAVDMVLGSAFPGILVWGPERVQIYNDAYAPLIGRRHPEALGMPTHDCWPELREIQEPIFARVFRGETVHLSEAPYPLDLHGRVEIRAFDASFSPVRAEGGEVGGSFSTLFDVTGRAEARAFQAERERLLAAEREARRAAEAAAARTSRVLEVIADAHVLLDPEFRFVHVNPAAERALAKPREALLGRTHWEVFPASVHAEAGRAYRRAVEEGVESHLTQHYRWEGYDIHLEIGAYPTKEGGVAIFWRDVTERVRAEQSLRELNAALEARNAELDAERGLLRTVLGQLPVAVVIAEAPSGKVMAINDGVARIWGEVRPRTRSVGSYSREWEGYHRDGRRVAWDEWPLARAVLRGEVVSGWVCEIVRADGSRALIEISAAPTRDAEGRVMAAVAVISDVTAQVHARREVERLLAESERARADAERARAEAEAANRAKSEFLAVMSHELRTPLNAIGGYVELMEMGIRGAVSTAQREDLARIQRSQRHLLGLINEVLNYAKIETGSVRYEIAVVHVRDALSAAEGLVAPQIRAKGLELEIRAGPPGLAVLADPEKLRQVLVNLLSNAVKFTDRGGRVVLACEEDGELVHLSVRDTGIGIPADKLEAIFEPFVQVRADLARTAEGTGLGLAISRDLARGMGGDLGVESESGAGSTFTLVLPRSRG